MSALSIEQFEPGNEAQKAAFVSLNRAWLEKHFRIEPGDEYVFADPEGYILTRGGVILLAKLEGRYVGTVSLLTHRDGTYELGKMGVEEGFQGMGIGRRLGEAVIELARRRGVPTLYVVSNTKLIPAMTLYRALGFTDSSMNKHAPYERGNITLEKKLANNQEEAA